MTLIATTIASTATNRWLTFGVRGPRKALRHQVLGFALLAFGLGVTAGSLWLLEATTTAPGAWAELAVLAAANLTVGVVRFVSFKVAMVPEPDQGPAQPVTR